MSFTKKTWTDRISEYPTRRTLTKEDGTTETVTVTREEGTISQEGDAYSAANMNDLEQRVADGFSTLSQDSVKLATKNTTSDSIAFGIDSNGNYGYIKEGADTVTPFSNLKQGEPFNISLSIPNDYLKNNISITFPKPPKMVIAQLPGHTNTHYPTWLGFVNYDNKDTTINCDLATGWNSRGGGYSCTITVYWAY